MLVCYAHADYYDMRQTTNMNVLSKHMGHDSRSHDACNVRVVSANGTDGHASRHDTDRSVGPRRVRIRFLYTTVPRNHLVNCSKHIPNNEQTQHEHTNGFD